MLLTVFECARLSSTVHVCEHNVPTLFLLLQVFKFYVNSITVH